MSVYNNGNALSFLLSAPGLPRVVPGWLVTTVVSGQVQADGSSSLVVATRAPVVTALTFDVSAPNGTHFFITILVRGLHAVVQAR